MKLAVYIVLVFSILHVAISKGKDKTNNKKSAPPETSPTIKPAPAVPTTSSTIGPAVPTTSSKVNPVGPTASSNIKPVVSANISNIKPAVSASSNNIKPAVPGNSSNVEVPPGPSGPSGLETDVDDPNDNVIHDRRELLATRPMCEIGSKCRRKRQAKELTERIVKEGQNKQQFTDTSVKEVINGEGQNNGTKNLKKMSPEQPKKRDAGQLYLLAKDLSDFSREEGLVQNPTYKRLRALFDIANIPEKQWEYETELHLIYKDVRDPDADPLVRVCADEIIYLMFEHKLEQAKYLLQKYDKEQQYRQYTPPSQVSINAIPSQLVRSPQGLHIRHPLYRRLWQIVNYQQDPREELNYYVGMIEMNQKMRTEKDIYLKNSVITILIEIKRQDAEGARRMIEWYDMNWSKRELYKIRLARRYSTTTEVYKNL